MCLTPITRHLRRATTNIIVGKSLEPLHAALWQNGKKYPANGQYWISPFRGFIYRDGEMYESPLHMERRTGHIYEGLHSYCGGNARYCVNSNAARKALIPAGAYFVLGVRGEIVSTHLIVLPTKSRLQKRAITSPTKLDAMPIIAEFRNRRSGYIVRPR